MPQKRADIFGFLSKVNNKDRTCYSSLPEEERKTLAPLVIQRWLTGTSDAQQIYLLNEIVNPLIFDLNKHPDLLFQLMVACSSGTRRRYAWKKAKSKKTTSMPTTVHVVSELFGYSKAEALEVIPILSDNDILDIANEVGTQPDELKKLKKELKGRNV